MRPKSTHSPNKAGTRGSKNSPAKGSNSQGRILRSRTVSGEVSPSSSNNGSPRLRRTSTASSASVDEQSTRQSNVRQTAANSKNASPKPRTSPRTRNESGKAAQSPKCTRTREEVSPVQAASPNPKRVRRNLNESFDADSKAETTTQEAKNSVDGKVENGMNGSSGSVKPSDSSESAAAAGTCSSCGKTPVCGNHITCSTKNTEDDSVQASVSSGSEQTKHSCKCRTQTSSGTSQCKHKDTSSGSSELNSSLRNSDQREVVVQDQEKPPVSGGESESKEEEVDDSFPTVDYRKLDNEDYSQPFYFESDHVALKDNKEYHLMLKTLVMLEAQRSQAVQDIDRLAVKEEEALKDPVDFVEKLQCNAVSLPRPQNVLNLPSIQWENYAGWVGKVDPSLFMPAKRHLTRTKRQPEATITSSDSASNYGEGSSQQGTSRVEDGPQLVRGRLRGPSKPATFNLLWTTEEQRKLEYLLEVFPPEEIEARRWQKIAEALGNRTAKQVASRVQKYFIKLAKAGLPIPGRMPANNHTFSKKLPFMKYRRHDMFRQALCQPSTFMASHLPPVYMSDNDDDSTSQSTSQLDWEQETDDVSDDESVPVELRQTEDYRELMRLKRLKMVKERRRKQEESMGITQHVEYRCDRCESDPIMGVRWHCLDCPPDRAVDFCQDCVDCDHETEVHKSHHRLEPISHMSEHTYMDMDYTRFSVKTGDYNYLDPNYFPSTS